MPLRHNLSCPIHIVKMHYLSTLFVLAPSLVAAQNGCGADPPLAPGTSHTHNIDSAGGSREYIVFLPASYDKNSPTPLILNFPGHSDTDSYQETLTSLDDPYFNTDHIVLYPQGVSGTDGLSAFSGAPYSDPNVDDLQFASDLLDHAAETYCIDTSRVFATGKSNGGGFVNYLACHDISSRFTAFAPVAGAYYTGFGADGADCKPARSPQPILEMHGYNDTTIAYYGDADHNGGALPAVLDWARDWAGRNGCPGSPGNMSSL